MFLRVVNRSPERRTMQEQTAATLQLTSTRACLVADADSFPRLALVPAPTESVAFSSWTDPRPTVTVGSPAVGRAAPRRGCVAARRRRLSLTDSWREHAMDVVRFQAWRWCWLLLQALVALPWWRQQTVPDKRNQCSQLNDLSQFESCLFFSFDQQQQTQHSRPFFMKTRVASDWSLELSRPRLLLAALAGLQSVLA